MSKPCIKCGSTERNKRGDCLACIKAYRKGWYQRHKGQVAAYKKAWCAAHPERAKDFDLQVRLKRYGLTIEQYRVMFSQQKGLCCICQRGLDRVDIDHDHTTDHVRGLLCHACNIGLGAFQDDPQLLLCAVKYLKSARSTVPAEVACTTT